MSPLYVSVHATPWEARKVLLNNPRVPNIVEQLTLLSEGGIQFHAQMVIVPGLNDGDVLEESFRDLYALDDAVMSVAIVPVGLTQFSHLYTGKSMDRDNARKLLEVVERWSDKALEERGDRWVLRLGRIVPARRTRTAGRRTLRRISADRKRRGCSHNHSRTREERFEGAAAHGRTTHWCCHRNVSMAPLMPELLEQLTAATGAEFVLIPVENSLFGPTTTTAGLLVGADFRRALSDRHDLTFALIPAESINDDGLFLDDEPFIAMREAMPMPVFPSYDFIDALVPDGQRVLHTAA